MSAIPPKPWTFSSIIPTFLRPRPSQPSPVDHENSAIAPDSQVKLPTPEQSAEAVRELARQITNEPASNRSSSTQTEAINPFKSGTLKTDHQLDPNSDEFNAQAWIRSMLALKSRDPDRYSSRTAGVSFSNLSVHGYGSPTDYQKTVGNLWLDYFGKFKRHIGVGKKLTKIQILRDFEGLVRSGEMLVVLGRPGSGCSTFLKTIAGETHGVFIDSKSNIQYQGIPASTMHKDFRGEVIYMAETDVHFPMLTVGETLLFAARARAPRNRMPGISREQYATHMRDVVMALYGLSHTINTMVGNEFVRGVSGGERKRVSIAECTLSFSPVQCWDNCTRGLDSANALEFIRTVRLGTQSAGSTALVSIYQCSQSSYDVFDKVIVLYEGRQIYFGPSSSAREFFTSRGWHCPHRQTTADFLTSLTNPTERTPLPGWENRVPRTANEFAKQWMESEEREKLMLDIQEYEKEYVLGGEAFEKFKKSRNMQQARHMSVKSPYTISFPMQIKLCTWRGMRRLSGDTVTFYSMVFGNFVMALVIGSVYYNIPDNTASFYSRGSLLFFAILMNTFASGLEILTLYAQRPIVEKHRKFALYHPIAEAVSSMLCGLPSKILVAISFNTALYFMANLRREPGAFFVFLLFSFFATLTMSSVFRTIAAVSRTLAEALAPAALFILMLIIYTGFAIPTSYMTPWFRWLNYLNPVAYAFESLMINEFHDREFPCSYFIPSGPGYANATGLERSCGTTGSVAGSDIVNGDRYINQSFKYFASHKWRNFGVVIAFWILFTFTYLLATDKIQAAKSKGEVLVFRRGYIPAHMKSTNGDDEEKASEEKKTVRATPLGEGIARTESLAAIHRQTKIFHWRDVCYDIKIKGNPRRLLDNVDGWVKPGTLTALMGESGAGKTTLLDVLANRVTMGVISGDMFIQGRQRDDSFQRKTGYVQQQDLHLGTSTVRESLTFSALLRQSRKIPTEEKLAYVEEVIKLLDMQDFAEAVVGVPGDGLNVEQRKRLTIGVELAAKPDLLLFLDEPTSGLDSQTAWSICQLMRKLANNGQAVLCTIHQPSAILMQEFDRLLFLAAGGKTVYFGDIGENCSTLTNYFEIHGAHPCPPQANPAEWMLEVIGAAPGHHSTIDWYDVWRNSDEYQTVHKILDDMEEELPKKNDDVESPAGSGEFAMPLTPQLWYCLKRVWEQYWRTPSYIYSKAALAIFTSLFTGFSFYKADNTIQGLQDQMFSVFMLLSMFGNITQQIMPLFVEQRSLYEARERPSKAYSWKAFLGAQILVEFPWQLFMAIIAFFSWYYPIGFYRNAIPTDTVYERGGLMFLLILSFYLYSSTFAQFIIAAVETADAGGQYGNLLFTLTLIFCGVLATPAVLPRFWIFMYRISPFTYMVAAMLSTAVANTDVHCSSIELAIFNPPSGQTCGDYMSKFITLEGGAVYNPNATSACEYCSITSTNTFLKTLFINYSDRWRDFGLIWVYIIINVVFCVLIYWLVRVPKKSSKKKEV